MSWTFRSSNTLNQQRQKLRTTHIPPHISRPAFQPNSPFLPINALVGAQWKPAIDPNHAPHFPILIPLAAVDPKLTKKITNPLGPSQQEPQDVRQVTLDGKIQLEKVVEDWVRNELNVMGTIREKTIEVFLKLLLHPSTLAPLAEKMKLRTAGRRVPVKASHHAPQRLVPASTVADEEMSELLYYLIGSIQRTLAEREGSTGRLKRYITSLLLHGLPHTSARLLLIRASQLSGQAAIGNQAGHARAEIRVAQLEIWGARRDKKIRKLVPEQVAHRTPLRVRKAQILKQRWTDEEIKMVHWRNRLLKITAIQENEAETDHLRRLEHAQKVKQWNQDRLHQQATASPPPTLLSKLFNFWPFSSSEQPTTATATKALSQ